MEKLIEFETAKLANEKGVKIDCRNTFDVMDDKIYEDLNAKAGFIASYPRPTQEGLKNILRKTHFLYVLVIPTINCSWTFKILDVQCDPQNQIERPPYSGVDANDYSTYEEAMEVGLKEVLNKINKKK
jgi:hypothetical protein